MKLFLLIKSNLIFCHFQKKKRTFVWITKTFNCVPSGLLFKPDLMSVNKIKLSQVLTQRLTSKSGCDKLCLQLKEDISIAERWQLKDARRSRFGWFRAQTLHHFADYINSQIVFGFQCFESLIAQAHRATKTRALIVKFRSMRVKVNLFCSFMKLRQSVK